jgi:hypothetical protein
MGATWKELHAAALRAPDDDAARLALAEYHRKQDPDRTKFMELQVELGARRRARQDANPASEYACQRLLKKHGAEWGRTIAKYTREHRYDRGMIELVTIDPHLFLEHGTWLLVNAPLRAVMFAKPSEGAFPLAEVLASDAIERLDVIGFNNLGLTDADVEQIAAAPKLHRLLELALTDNPLSVRAFEAIAASPHLRNLLMVDRRLDARVHAYSPIASMDETERDDRHGHRIWEYRALPPDGVALEAKHGYLPWLHPKENGCSPFDARYFIERGELPVKKRGTPVR